MDDPEGDDSGAEGSQVALSDGGEESETTDDEVSSEFGLHDRESIEADDSDADSESWSESGHDLPLPDGDDHEQG